jgi:hypothetical protein
MTAIGSNRKVIVTKLLLLLLERGEFSVIISGLGVAIEPRLGPLSAATCVQSVSTLSATQVLSVRRCPQRSDSDS